MARLTPSPTLRPARVLGLGLGVALTALVAGCAEFPELAAQRVSAGPAPVLVPLDGILAQADAVGAGADAVGSVDVRADALRDRAERLRSQ